MKCEYCLSTFELSDNKICPFCGWCIENEIRI